MKRSTHRRKAGRADDATGVSLFPFLAVLICTVGALILVLVVLGRHARLQAAQAAQTQKTQSQSDVKKQLELVRWRIGHYQESLRKTETQLADARLELGHLEDHSRRLRQQLAEMERAWKQLEQTGSDATQQAAVARQLRELSSQIDEMKQRVDQARRDALQNRHTYAVIPYEGPHGTRRRPIYIECRKDAVVLQPEQIVFRSADFEGPLGPDNPLATALRATREYLLRQGQLDPKKSGEPYPLLLVRPTGIVAYCAARAAMRSWESEFGYELIDEDWELAFDPPDEELARVVREEIEAARARQLRLALAAPRHFDRPGHSIRGGRPQYTVSQGTGVVVPYGEDGVPVEQSRHRRPARDDTSRGGSSGGPDSDGTDSGGGSPGDGNPNGAAPSGNHPGGSPGDADGEVSTNVAGARPGHAGSPGLGGGNGSSTSPGSGLLGGSGGTSDGSSPRSSGGNPLRSSSGDSTSSMADGSPGSPGSPGADNQSATTPGEGAAASPPSAERSGQSQATGSARRLGQWQPSEQGAAGARLGPPSPGHRSHGRPKSLAKKRGRDWAMPETSREATPLAQPIRIECHGDRLALVAAPGLSGSRAIALGPRTQDAVDELVSAIWDYTESWGIAGRGMYWRPVLHVYVFPGAEHRYADLEALLQNSGLLIERKQLPGK